MKRAFLLFAFTLLFVGWASAEIIFEDDFEDGTLEPWVENNIYGQVVIVDGDYALETWGYWNDVGEFYVELPTLPDEWTLEFEIKPRPEMTIYNNMYMGMTEGVPSSVDEVGKFELIENDLDNLQIRWNNVETNTEPLGGFPFDAWVHVIMNRAGGLWTITWDVGGINETVITGEDYFVDLSNMYLFVMAGPHYESENGAFFDNFVITVPPAITVWPLGNTIIPPQGGMLSFAGEIQNGADPIETSVWTNVTLPNGNDYGPLLAFENMHLPTDHVINFQGIQFIPNFAPPGLYTYNAMLGSLPNTIIAQDSFPFSKAGGTATISAHERGWDADVEITVTGDEIASSMPEQFEMAQAYPNPFNGTVGVNLTLPSSGELTVTVYDITGRMVETMANGIHAAGQHRLQWSPVNQASGIYFVHAAVNGANAQVQKVMYVQ